MSTAEYVRGPGPKRRTVPPTPIYCPWPNCGCTHTEGCEGGWIDSQVPAVDDSGRPRLRPDGKPIMRNVTKPCPRCRPEAYRNVTDPQASTWQKGHRLRTRKER